MVKDKILTTTIGAENAFWDVVRKDFPDISLTLTESVPFQEVCLDIVTKAIMQDKGEEV